jgi:hypothetical protein
MSEEGFFSRWSRRKAGAPEATPAQPPAPAAPPADAAPAEPATAEVAAPPPPTLDDVAALDAQASDFQRFVAPDVDPTVKNAALKKLFTDPQWNVMDGLDVYIDDYGKPDPVPESVLRKMAQSQFLGLFRDEEAAAAAQGQNPPPAPAMQPLANEDPDLRLQPDDAARPGGDPSGAREDAGGEH